MMMRLQRLCLKWLKLWLRIKGMVVMVRKTKEKLRSRGLIVS